MKTLTNNQVRSMLDYPLQWWTFDKYTLEMKGKYIKNWFSNMDTIYGGIQGVDDGIVYPTVEHYFQAHKTLELDERREVGLMTPYEAKRWGRGVTTHVGWGDGLGIMFEALTLKWGKPFYRDRLLAYKGEIVEWNNWSDGKWGVPITVPVKPGNYQGRNILGLMLMEIRESIRA